MLILLKAIFKSVLRFLILCILPVTLYAAGPFSCCVFFIPHHDLTLFPIIKSTAKHYQHVAYIWPLQLKALPKNLLKQNIPPSLNEEGVHFAIPSFEHYNRLTFYRLRSLDINNQTFNPFDIFEENKRSSIYYKLPIQQEMLGHLEILSVTKEELKIKFLLDIDSYQVQFNEQVPLNRWIVIDNPAVTALIRISSLTEQ
jgi:hypothetical protein